MSVQIHEKHGKPCTVTMSYKEYHALMERQEELETIARAQTITSRIEAGMEETFPADVVNRIVLEDENPIRVYREYRHMTQQQLADKAGIARAYLTEIETGKKQGAIATLKAIAQALDVDLNMVA